MSVIFCATSDPGAGKNAFDAGRIADQHDGIAADRRVMAIVEFEQRGLPGAGASSFRTATSASDEMRSSFAEIPSALPGKYALIGNHIGGGTAIEQFFQLVVIPPRFGDVMVGDDAAVFANKEARPEDIDLEVGSTAAGVELHHSMIVDRGLPRPSRAI